ncbi:MAG: YlbF family regulator [Finegoldia magna]|nr:YlbF family regulator [Finegoldia magna]
MEYKKKAEELAQMLNNSQEFQELKKLHKEVYKKNETNKNMIDDFKKHLFEYQLIPHDHDKHFRNRLKFHIDSNPANLQMLV